MNVIISRTRDALDGEPLYWSNADGWVSLPTADHYPDRSGNLPDDGLWIAACCALYAEHRDTDRHTGDNYVEGCPTCDPEVATPDHIEPLSLGHLYREAKKGEATE